MSPWPCDWRMMMLQPSDPVQQKTIPWMMFSSLWCHSMLTIPCFCLLWTRHCLCSDLDGIHLQILSKSRETSRETWCVELPTVQNQHKNQQRHLRHDRGSFLHGGIVIDRWNLFLVNSRMKMVPCLNYEILKNAKQQCLNRAQQKVLLSNFRRRERIIIFTLLARAGFSQRLSWVCLARIKWCTK